MSMDQIQEYRCPLSPVGETPLSPAYSASKCQRYTDSVTLIKHKYIQILTLFCFKSPGRERTQEGGPWLLSHPHQRCVVPATLSSAPPPVTTLRSIPRIPLIQHTPHPPIIKATNRIPRKQQGATVTSDLAPPGPPNPRLKATWNDCEWKKGEWREQGRKERGCSALHRWRHRPPSGHPGTR